MTETIKTGKPLVQSKTFQGQTAVIAAFVAAVAAGTMPDYELIIQAIAAIGAVIGYCFSIYGRYTAHEPINGIIASVVADLSAKDEEEHA